MKRNILGEIIVVGIMLGIVWMFIVSMGGTLEKTQDTYDGSSRLIYP